MAIKKTLQIGNPILRQKSRSVGIKEIKTPGVKKVIKNLKDSFSDGMVIGMAAPQIGCGLRIFVTEIKETKSRKGYKADPLRVYINPQIIKKSKKETILYEGCVSIPNIFGPVKRPERITIKAYDQKGKLFVLNAADLLSKVIQHEYDHLEGVLFMDRVVDNRKLMSKDEYIKARKANKIP